MTKLKALLFLSIFGLSFLSANANNSLGVAGEKPTVIPRVSWGANSQYNSKTEIYWKQILETRSNYTAPERSQAQIDYAIKKNKDIEDYLYGNFLYQFTSQETLKTKQEGKYEFAWPLKYTNFVDSIIVHHTHSEYDDTISGLQDIHRYHSINREWGDIGYNYIIGYNGNIYEGREGGDYVVGAHSKYNNFGTVGIAIMGNYDSNGVNSLQYESLEKLIQYLIVKYGIDLSNKRYYHRNCSGNTCDTFHIETYLDSVLIGHRDATHTTCPGEMLYKQIQEIRTNNLEFSKGLNPVLRNKKSQQISNIKNETNTSQIQKILTLVQKFSPEEKQEIITLIDKKRAETTNTETLKKLQIIRFAIVLSEKD